MQVSKDNKSRGPTGESINRLLRTQTQVMTRHDTQRVNAAHGRSAMK